MGEASSPRELVIQVNTNSPAFDPGYSVAKEKFNQEFRRVDSEMKKLRANLKKIYSRETLVQGPNDSHIQTAAIWNVVVSSPLVKGEGENRSLALMFDVSQYQPNEVTVEIVNELVVVSARHEVVTESSTDFREFSREFPLPKEVDVEGITSSISSDGVLTVNMPIPYLPVSQSLISN